MRAKMPKQPPPTPIAIHYICAILRICPMFLLELRTISIAQLSIISVDRPWLVQVFTIQTRNNLIISTMRSAHNHVHHVYFTGYIQCCTCFSPENMDFKLNMDEKFLYFRFNYDLQNGDKTWTCINKTAKLMYRVQQSELLYTMVYLGAVCCYV